MSVKNPTFIVSNNEDEQQFRLTFEQDVVAVERGREGGEWTPHFRLEKEGLGVQEFDWLKSFMLEACEFLDETTEDDLDDDLDEDAWMDDDDKED